MEEPFTVCSSKIDHTPVIEFDGRGVRLLARRMAVASGPCGDKYEKQEKAPKKDEDLHGALLILS